MKRFAFYIGTIVITMSLSASCSKDDPVIPNEEELITTLTFTLTPAAGGPPIVMTFRDLDGEGGTDPIITGGTLNSNTSYNGTVNLSNDLAIPPQNITLEIEEEGDAHQFFYDVSSDLEMTINYSDADNNGKPVGLATTVSTGNASEGDITIILRHEPDKSAPGVQEGEVSNAGGETDIEVSFDVTIV